ncbi:MAG: phospholipase [Gemmatimonadaceae bacterium]|nr:phospholipase [Gloeobacterales cyanobacterium ES-bin-141]
MEALAAALESGRAVPPYTRVELQHLVGTHLAASVATELSRLAGQGMQPVHAAYLIRLLAAERRDAEKSREQVEIVWTGDDRPGVTSRDTAVVVRELFASARKSVLIASYALDRGDKALELFGELASRFDSEPGLSVRLVINIQRPHQGNRSEAELVDTFGRLFREEIWPGSRLPEVFYDPRALQKGGLERACQHAKCVVIDEEQVLVTSANFTEAAHHRNIEVGVLLSDPAAALGVSNQFDLLIRTQSLRPLPSR